MSSNAFPYGNPKPRFVKKNARRGKEAVWVSDKECIERHGLIEQKTRKSFQCGQA